MSNPSQESVLPAVAPSDCGVPADTPESPPDDVLVMDTQLPQEEESQALCNSQASTVQWYVDDTMLEVVVSDTEEAPLSPPPVDPYDVHTDVETEPAPLPIDPYEVDTEVDTDQEDVDDHKDKTIDEIPVPASGGRRNTLKRRRAKLRLDLASPPKTVGELMNRESPPRCSPNTPEGTPKTITWPTVVERSKLVRRKAMTGLTLRKSLFGGLKRRLSYSEDDEQGAEPDHSKPKCRKKSDADNVVEQPEEGKVAFEECVEPPEEKASPLSKYVVDLVQELITMTIDFIKDLPATGPDSIVRNILMSIHDAASFCRVVYRRSKAGIELDELFWKASKNITCGSSHSLDLFLTRGEITRATMMPMQFGGVKGEDKKSICAFFQEMGAFGEMWMDWHLTFLKKCWEKPGKICQKLLPISSTTSDGLLFTGNYDCPPNAPIDFDHAINGIVECKTSKLKENTPSVWDNCDVTVREIVDVAKSSTVQQAVMLKDSTIVKSVPNWVTAEIYHAIMSSMIRTIKWGIAIYRDGAMSKEDYIWRDFDMSILANNMIIKLFTNTIGRQILCECMTVLDYVVDDYIEVVVYLPSVRNLNDMSGACFKMSKVSADGFGQPAPPRAEFEVAYSLIVSFKLPTAELRRLNHEVLIPRLAATLKNFAVSKNLMKP